MPFRTVIPVLETQCAIASGGQCVKREKFVGYEVRTYVGQIPFEVSLFDVTDEKCIFKKSQKAVYFRRGKNVQGDRSNGSKAGKKGKD